ncbi:hypothetical protein [Chitinasiproducens palmae]|uniref:Tetratricopeptide repeat protein n=1 Tax=Chitinasiproducens palmae TaxID=1770053 RepID=A0A1H2PWK3_9BURK|nr:hypothetical protein [Chitinasiproducens palmae]SDV51420.1 hypothetical protein SAMN05216551_11727 [Chitinasiproducens palmae]
MRVWTPLLVTAALVACADVGSGPQARRQRPVLASETGVSLAGSPAEARAAAHRALAAAYLNDGRADVALLEARRALAAIPDDPFALHLAALASAALGRRDHALAFFMALFGQGGDAAPADRLAFAETQGIAAAANLATLLCASADGRQRREAMDALSRYLRRPMPGHGPAAGEAGAGAVEAILRRCRGGADAGRRDARQRTRRRCAVGADQGGLARRGRMAKGGSDGTCRRAGARGRISTHCRPLHDLREAKQEAMQDKE